MKNPVAIIDSGLGGLSVLCEIFNKTEETNFVYMADLKNLPYGEKTKEQLLKITVNNLKILIKKYKPKYIVFGCNTIATTILDDIKIIFPKQKIFAINPMATKANFKNNFTLIIATKRTILNLKNSFYYKANSSRIVLCKMPMLANKIENNYQNTANIVPYIKRRLVGFKNAAITQVVLGCTHYYFIKNQIQRIFINAKIIDNLNSLLQDLYSQKLVAPEQHSNKLKPKVKFIITKNYFKTKKLYKKIIADYCNK